jgi:hypothetical protein
MEKTSKKYWDSIKVGSIVQLDDQQTLEFLIEKGFEGIEHGADFEVKRIKDISEQDNLAIWRIIYIEFKEILWYLVIKMIDGENQLRIYYQPDDFDCGNREDMINNYSEYLFKHIEDMDNCNLNDLEFADSIMDHEFEYTSEGVFYGASVEDGKEDFATVVEYATDTECENPYLLVLELCNVETIEQYDEDDDVCGSETDIDFNNGFIMLLQGCDVNINDIEVLN